MNCVMHLIGQLGRGGAEKQLYGLAVALQKRGWRQSVVSFSPGGVWAERLEAAGIRSYVIPRGPLKPWRFWRLFRLARRVKPNIIVSWSMHAAVYAEWLFGIGPAAKIINLRCNLLNDQRTGVPKNTLGSIRGTLERADQIVSNSRANLDVLRAQGVRLPPAEVIYNMVDGKGGAPPGECPDFRRPLCAAGDAERIGENGTAPFSTVPRVPAAQIVAIGTLIPLKALDVLLRAAAILAGEGKRFEIVLAGNGPERANLETLATELGISDQVIFPGEVDDVPALLAAADILAHPSRSEGLSNTILEAMAEGIPVVACPVGATPEIIDDGRSGLLVPVGEPQALAAALGRLLGDAALRSDLGRNAREYVRQRFDEATIVGQYERVFQQVMAHRA
jgi:glycosyltransferase involved in cell wall biosynthesis